MHVNIKRVQQVDFITISNRYKKKLDKVIEEAEQKLKQMVPKRTGKLANSIKLIKAIRGSQWGYSIKALGYYAFLDQGTKDHYIAPKKARALAWTDEEGVIRFSKGHKVKGIERREFSIELKKWILSRLKTR